MSRSAVCLVLASANAGYIFLIFTSAVIQRIHGTSLFSWSDTWCKFMISAVGFLQHLDSWMIILLGLERMFSVIKPYLAKTFITRRKMTICAIFFVIIFFIFDSYIGIVYVNLVVYPSGRRACRYPANIAITIRQLFFGQIPLIILIPCNTLIILKLIKQRKLWKQNDKDVKSSFRVTIMVLAITLAYIILALPLSIFLLCCNDPNPNTWKNLNIISFLQMTNASVNFYLYFFSSQIFREEVKKELQKMKNVFSRWLGCQFCQNAVDPQNAVAMAESLDSRNDNAKPKSCTASTVP